MSRNTDKACFRTWDLVCIALAFLCSVQIGCGRRSDDGHTSNAQPASGLQLATRESGIYWPPQDLSGSTDNIPPPLLKCELTVSQQSSSATTRGDIVPVHMAIMLTRPSTDADRLRWNEVLAFPEYSWMAAVRVWDLEGDWIWPNLPYLLRAHGENRIDRYGGVDPSKMVDNDFAAILVRPLGGASVTPLVSAEWYPVETNEVDKHTVVHRARSDEFVLQMMPNASPKEFGVWLIYADIMEAKMPRSWPKEGEFDGGILAYFEIEIAYDGNSGLDVSVSQRVPKSSTGFDWKAWSTDQNLEKNLIHRQAD